MTAAVIVMTCTAAPAAENVTMRVMPSPETPEADFSPETVQNWDVSLGYGRVWFDNPYGSGSLNGAAAALVYRGVFSEKFGYTISPLTAGMFFGESNGYSADSWYLGTGFSIGSRFLGRKDSHNLIVFGGGAAAWTLDQDNGGMGEYRLDSGFFGFTSGLKAQLAPARFVKIRPFYVYMGGGGRYRLALNPVVPPPSETTGALGYQDVHLLGLDFNVYGVSAKMIGDFFRDESGTFTILVNIIDTVQGVKKAAARRERQ
jgi:hypothetical protein